MHINLIFQIEKMQNYNKNKKNMKIIMDLEEVDFDYNELEMLYFN